MTDEDLIAAARDAATRSYSPYSKFAVGAALLLADDSVVTGANVENASYGLALCAETVAVGKVLSEDWRGGLVKVAVVGPGADPITPCGRCRQVLNEVAQLGGTDPEVLCAGPSEVRRMRLSELLPHAFGPASLG
ncbi:MAG: cytidine deaminase [Tsuneonella sp.]